MTQTVIGEIYTSFTKKELKGLDKYIHSSQWQNSDTIVKSHECIAHYTSKDKLDTLDKEKIFTYVYDGEPYSDAKLRFTLNRLLTAIREYIVVREFENDNIFTQKIWMDFLDEKKLKKNVQYSIENVNINSNSDYNFLFKYFKSQEQNIYETRFTKDVKARYDSFLNIMKSAETFSDLVFIRNYCSLIAFTNLYSSMPFELPIDKFNEIKEKAWEKDLPEFAVYMSLIDLLIHNTGEYYQIYKKTLFNNFDIWVEDEKVNLLIYLLNFSIGQINKGDSSYIDEQYNLFNIFEEQGIFSYKSYINTTRINNVVHIYLRKKEFDRAERFVTKYVHMLDADLADSCQYFNLARIKYETKSYKESLRDLLKVDFGKDTFYSINSKFLLLKNYYELRESDALDSLCVSFKEYIRKNKVISDTYKNSCLNFIRMLEKSYGVTKLKAVKLKEELEKSTQIAEKNWLMEKIEEKLA
jgi:hypothetical protein